MVLTVLKVCGHARRARRARGGSRSGAARFAHPAPLTIFSAEINVVRLHRLWPRSFFSVPLLDADRRALTGSAEVEERVEEENVEVNFDDPE
jgi:hypothetical protein